MPAKNYLDLDAAAERSGRSVNTLRRYIKAGRLPAVKEGRKIYVTTVDLDAAVAPSPMAATESEVRIWAHRMADAAPPFRPEQRDLIVAAFASALGGS